jgi:hypothetical protein
MPKMPHAGEDHGEASFIGGGNDFVVPHRSTRLNHSGGSCFGSGEQAVSERKECVGGDG